MTRRSSVNSSRMRSNIESAFSMIKGKFGDSLRSKSDAGQINEALCKVLCHNICVLVHAIHALNIEPVFRQPLQDDWLPASDRLAALSGPD